MSIDTLKFCGKYLFLISMLIQLWQNKENCPALLKCVYEVEVETPLRKHILTGKDKFLYSLATESAILIKNCKHLYEHF